LGKRVYGAFLQAQGSGDLGASVQTNGQEIQRLEHLHDRSLQTIFGTAAHLFYPEGSSESVGFFRTYLEIILNKEVNRAIVNLKQLAESRGIKGTKKKSSKALVDTSSKIAWSAPGCAGPKKVPRQCWIFGAKARETDRVAFSSLGPPARSARLLRSRAGLIRPRPFEKQFFQKSTSHFQTRPPLGRMVPKKRRIDKLLIAR
jgi:hypothetical protein